MRLNYESSLAYKLSPCVGLVLGLMMIAVSPARAASPHFEVPEDTALRVRLDDTLTSIDSQEGDPFSATVVDAGQYRNARVYGHVAAIDMSGKVEGRTSMMLRFDRLVMPDGSRAPIQAEIVELYHAPSGEKVDVEGAIESAARGLKSVIHTAIGAGAGGLGTTAFHGHQKITLSGGQEMLIRITAH